MKTEAGRPPTEVSAGSRAANVGRGSKKLFGYAVVIADATSFRYVTYSVELSAGIGIGRTTSQLLSPLAVTMSATASVNAVAVV